jgi:hypothetical protein
MKNELLNVCGYSHSFGTRQAHQAAAGRMATDQTQLPRSPRANYRF